MFQPALKVIILLNAHVVNPINKQLYSSTACLRYKSDLSWLLFKFVAFDKFFDQFHLVTN